MKKADAVDDLRKPPGERESAAHLTIWQVNFADDQILELTQAEIQQDLVAGNLSRENYVWREGMATWLPIADVPEFAKAASIAPSSGFRPRPDDEVETVPLDPEDDEKTVALKNPSFLAGYERSSPTLEFSIDGDAETAEPPTTRAPAVTPSVVPSRMERIGGDKTPAYGSVPPAASSTPPAATRSSAPAAILLRGSAPPEAVVRSSAPPAAKVSAPPGSVRIASQPVATKIPTSPIITPPAAPKGESPPPLPSRKPVIPVSTTSSPTSSPRPQPQPAPEQPARARSSVFPPPSPGAELVAPRPVPQAELTAPKPMPAEPLVATPAPPLVFEDPGLLPPEEMKSDAVWPAPDPSLARKAAQAAETPLPLRQRAVAAPAVAETPKAPSLKAEPVAADPPPTRESDEAKARKEAEAARPRPIGNEPLVIVAGPSETLPPSPTDDPEKPARDLTPKPVKSAPPIVMREAHVSKAQLVDIKSSDLMNESTLITGRRRTKHWVSMTNAIISAVCLAAIASALTALVMQATEQSRARHAQPAVAVAPAVNPPVRPEPAPAPVTVAAEKPPEATPAASAAAGEPVVAPTPVVTPEPKPEVTPEAPVAAKPARAPTPKRRPAQKASSTNPYDDYEPSKSESPKRAPAKASDDGTGIPSNPGF